MTIDFCFDQILDRQRKLILPNLCGLDTGISKKEFYHRRQELSVNFPYCDYPRLLEYAQKEGIKFSISTVDQAPRGSFYLVNINFYVPDYDYFAGLSEITLRALQQQRIKLLFFYCEADVPDRLNLHFADLCKKYLIPQEQFYFISHNTRAREFTGWYYFNDDEILYNRTCRQFYESNISAWHNRVRSRKTTALTRTHKNWRAVFCGQLYSRNWTAHSWLSYCANDNKDNQDLFDCAFKPELNKKNHVVQAHNTWLADTETFLKNVPLLTDDLDNEIRNQYETFVPKYFLDAYWNIVIETHIDVENLPGVFITEKTWKPIAHFQPFVIMGCAGSLAHLRELGYQTFGEHIDESYDSETDHIKRCYKVLEVCDQLANLSHQELQDLNQRLKPIVVHNRNLFWASKKTRIQDLFQRLVARG